MKREKFINDDRFAVLSNSDISCAGGNKSLAIQRLLDNEMDCTFEAVLDGDTVWTAKLDDEGQQVRDEDGMTEIEWTALSDFPA